MKGREEFLSYRGEVIVEVDYWWKDKVTPLTS